MDSKEVVSDEQLLAGAEHAFYDGADRSAGELRLMLLELICKSSAGYYNSHTEEKFKNWFGLLKRDRTPNKKGREFIVRMVYKHSNKRPECFELMKDNRSA